MSDKCFKKCIYKPGTSLDNSEQVCLVFFCPLEGVTNREEQWGGDFVSHLPKVKHFSTFCKKNVP